MKTKEYVVETKTEYICETCDCVWKEEEGINTCDICGQDFCDYCEYPSFEKFFKNEIFSKLVADIMESRIYYHKSVCSVCFHKFYSSEEFQNYLKEVPKQYIDMFNKFFGANIPNDN